MYYPNNKHWCALSNQRITQEENVIALSTLSCGKLTLPSGQLMVCDPFTAMRESGNHYYQVPPGEYEVIVTLADLSPDSAQDHVREAYATLVLDATRTEHSRQFLELTPNGKPSFQSLKRGEFFGYGVDAGTACFADAQAIATDMPAEDTWYETLFENDSEACWFAQMDDNSLIREGIANILLPINNNDNNLILFHSGWGDGEFPIIGGYDEQGKLIAVHTDFLVVSPNDDIPSETPTSSKPWWKFWR